LVEDEGLVFEELCQVVLKLTLSLLVLLHSDLLGQDQVYRDSYVIRLLLRVKAEFEEALLSYDREGRLPPAFFLPTDAVAALERDHVDDVFELGVAGDEQLRVANHEESVLAPNRPVLLSTLRNRERLVRQNEVLHHGLQIQTILGP